MTVDYSDWQTPQAHAEQIAVTGVPLLTLSTQVDTHTFTVLAGQSTTRGPFAVSQIGWEVGFSYSATAENTSPLHVTVIWSDVATGTVLDNDVFDIRAGTVANPHVGRMFGRSKGNQVAIKFDNTLNTRDATVTYTLFQNSRVVPRESFKTLTWGQVGTDIQPASSVPQGIIAISNILPNGNTSAVRQMPAYDGDVRVTATTASLTTDLAVQIKDGSANGVLIFDANSDAKGIISGVASLPKSQCILVISNNNAGPQTITVEVVAVASSP